MFGGRLRIALARLVHHLAVRFVNPSEPEAGGEGQRGLFEDMEGEMYTCPFWMALIAGDNSLLRPPSTYILIPIRALDEDTPHHCEP